MTLRWRAGGDGSGGPSTLRVGSLAAIPVKRANGVTDPFAGEVRAGEMRTLWYDGAAFRLPSQPDRLAPTTATQPACEESLRGRLWHVATGAGIKDSVSVCAKNETDTYAWRSLY